MKKKNKEISVFSMSAIDLFCSALGAFMVIALIAMPYYMKQNQTTPSTLQQELDALKEKLQQEQALEDSLAQSQKSLEQSIVQKEKEIETKARQLEELEKQLDETFLIVLCSWTADVDIDLYVEDPEHRGYSFFKKRHANAIASLAEDSTKAGIEIFETSKAIKGSYELHLVAFTPNANAEVSMRVYCKNGKIPLQSFKFNGQRKHSFTYKIDVLEKGDVETSIYEKPRNITKDRNGYVNITPPWN